MKAIRGIKFLPTTACYGEMPSPVGKLTIVTSKQGLYAVLWEVDSQNSSCENIIKSFVKAKHDPIIEKTKKQLTEYFQGQRKIFDLPLVLSGTKFQNQVWQQLLKIPYAKTISYGEQAKRLGDKNKARAVGLANGLNPVSIIVPCHRVIGSNGKLVGFAGGLEMKAKLLELERTGVIGQ